MRMSSDTPPAFIALVQNHLGRQPRWLAYLLALVTWCGAILFWRSGASWLRQNDLGATLAFLASGVGVALVTAWALAPAVRFASHKTFLIFARAGALVGLVLFGFYLWGENLFARWWIIDDEEIVAWFGQAHHLSPARVPQILADTGELYFFSGLRLRPMFWVFQTLEAVLWGDQPFLWYFFRIGIFIITLLLFLRLCIPLLGFLNSLLFAFYLGLAPYWADIFTRLGPAENYALLGLVGYVFAFVQIVRQTRRSAMSAARVPLGMWVVLGASGLICMGAKENFVFLLVPSGALLAFLLVSKRLSRAGAVTLVILAGWGALTLGSLFVTTRRAGVDIYGNSTLLQERLPLVLSAFKGLVLTPANGIGVGLILGMALVGVIHLRGIQAYERLFQMLYLLGASLGLGLGLACVLFLQLYIYNGGLPQNTRYDFPGMLVLPLFALLGFFLAQRIVRLVWQNEVLDRILTLTVSSLLVGALVLTGTHTARAASHTNVQRTQEFAAQIQLIRAVAVEHPNAALVLETHSGWDYEPSYSLVIFLRHAGVQNPIYLRHHGGTATQTNLPLELELAKRLDAVSTGTITWDYYQSFQRFHGGPCYSVAFSGQGAAPCDLITEISYY